MSIFLILAYISFLSAFIPAVTGIIKFNNCTKALKVLSVFAILTALMESIHTYLGSQGIHNMFMLHLYTPIEFTFFIVIFFWFSESNAKLPWFSYIIILLFSGFCILNAIYLESPKHFNSVARGIEGLVIICFCLYFFFKLFISEKTFDLLRYPYFWLFAGWLLYFSGTLFLFVYSYRGGLNATFSVIHSVLNIFLNLIFTYTLWLGSRKLT